MKDRHRTVTWAVRAGSGPCRGTATRVVQPTGSWANRAGSSRSAVAAGATHQSYAARTKRATFAARSAQHRS